MYFLTAAMEPFKVPTLNLEPQAPAGAVHPFEITPATPTPPDVRIIVPLERIPQAADFRAPQQLTRKKKILIVLGAVIAHLLLIATSTFTTARVFSPEAWWIGFILGLGLSAALDLFLVATQGCGSDHPDRSLV